MMVIIPASVGTHVVDAFRTRCACWIRRGTYPSLDDTCIGIRGASYDILNTRSRCLQQRMCFLDKGQHPLPPLDNAGVGVGVGVG